MIWRRLLEPGLKITPDKRGSTSPVEKGRLMKIRTCPVGAFQTNCYLVADEETREGVLIDPGDETERLLKLVRNEGVTVRALLLTHGHVDHVMRAQEVKEALKAPIYAHRADLDLIRTAPQQAEFFGLESGPVPVVDGELKEGEDFRVGNLVFQVLHTPGHTPGGIVLVSGNSAFVGDTIFAGSVGRTDLPGGDGRQLAQSIRTKLYRLPDETILYPGHGPTTTVGEEKSSNPYVRALDA
jgi:glyoxylase-like metal-dependent hydrolase (beta-lactamase superfamily II)